MKRTAISILIALMSLSASCAYRSGDGTKYTALNLGIQETLVNQTGQGYFAAGASGTDSFRETAKTARFGLGAAAFTSVAKSGFSALTSTKNATTAAGVTKSKDLTSLEAAKIQSAEKLKLAEMEAAAAAAQ